MKNVNVSLSNSMTKLFAIITFSLSSLLGQSCETNIDSLNRKQHLLSQNKETYEVCGKTYKRTPDLVKWREQLDKIIENSCQERNNNFKLIDYTFYKEIERIKDLDEIKNEMCNDGFILIGELGKTKRIDICTIKSDFTAFINRLLPTSIDDKLQVSALPDNNLSAKAMYIFENNDFNIVKLNWEYNGEAVTTVCLVSNKRGIIYDNFLYFITV